MKNARGGTAASKRHPAPTPRIGLPRLVSIAEVAERLGVTERHIRMLVAERRIPYVKWGHLLRFNVEEICAWIDEAHVDPTIHRAG